MKKMINKKSLVSFLVFGMILTFALPAFAATGSPKFVSGTMAMLQDLLKWILIILPIAAALIIAFGYTMKITSGHDPKVVSQQESIAKSVLKWAIIAECGSGIVTYVLSFYN